MESVLPNVNRRDFLVTKLSAGFAAAVQPISAATITTDTAGLTAGEVKIPVSGGEIPAYRALPQTGNGLPVVLVVQEIFGVHEHIKDICRRFAKAGYFAIAPEMYARQGDVSKMTDFQEIIQKVVAKVPDSQVMADLDAALAFAEKSGRVDSAKTAVTGYCWGGRIVWLYAAHSAKLKAGAAWYGRLLSGHNPASPKNPIDVAGQLKAPVLGLYGEADAGIPVDHVNKMKEALAAANGKSEILLYPGAPHGFYADYRPSYREDAAKDAWSRMLAWFKKNGAA